MLSIDESYERVFNEVLSLEAGVPKRLRVSLPEQTLTTFGKQEQARKAEEAKLAGRSILENLVKPWEWENPFEGWRVWMKAGPVGLLLNNIPADLDKLL